MTPLDQEHLLTFAKTYDLEEPTVEEGTGQIVSRFKIEDIEFPLFMRIFEGATLLQMIVFIPTKLEEKAYNDTGRLLHLLNKEIDLPGFGMDEDSSTIFFRHMLPCPQQNFDEELLRTLMDGMKLVCKSFSNAIAAVATGAVTFDKIVEQAKSAAKSNG